MSRETFDAATAIVRFDIDQEISCDYCPESAVQRVRVPPHDTHVCSQHVNYVSDKIAGDHFDFMYNEMISWIGPEKAYQVMIKTLQVGSSDET